MPVYQIKPNIGPPHARVFYTFPRARARACNINVSAYSESLVLSVQPSSLFIDLWISEGRPTRIHQRGNNKEEKEPRKRKEGRERPKTIIVIIIIRA